jgi:outer membrane protein OmpA-like peptidoglycan-associated protein
MRPVFAAARRSSAMLRRTCACAPSRRGCESCEKKKVLRRQALGGTELGGAPDIVHEVLQSPGEPLDRATRALLEPRFGHDFSNVRIHADERAAESATAVNALAYAVGDHIAFASGQFVPGSEKGRRLLTHELAHVAQKPAGRTAAVAHADLQIGHAAAPEEREADALAEAVLESRTPRPGRAGSGPHVLRRACAVTGGLGNSIPAATCATGSPLFVRGPRLKFCTDSDQLLDGQDGLFRDWVTKAKAAASVELHGNASEEGPSKQYNQRLSCQRTSAMAENLKAAGAATPSTLVAHGPTAVYGVPLENRNVVLVVDGTAKKAEAPPRPDEKPKTPDPGPGPPQSAATAPRSKSNLQDCTPDQETSIQEAMSRALSDLDGAIATLAARPLSEHAQNAMFMAFRVSDDKATEDVLANLKKIRAGLPGVTIECDQPSDVNVVCRGETAAATNIITGKVHLCMGDWDSSDKVKENPRTLVHEGAHRFAGAPGEGQDPYFDSGCDESSDTAAWGPGGRLGKADPLACVVYHLTHETAEITKDLKQLYSGESLTSIVQTKPKGPISLRGAERKPAFILNKAPVAGGFSFRWRLFDDSDRHYLLRGRESDEALDWHSFTDQSSAIIGSKTRDLLTKRGVRKGVIEVTARIPLVKGGRTVSEDKTLSLDVEFTD